MGAGGAKKQGTVGTSSQQLWGSELQITFLEEPWQRAEATTKVTEYWQTIRQTAPSAGPVLYVSPEAMCMATSPGLNSPSFPEMP